MNWLVGSVCEHVQLETRSDDVFKDSSAILNNLQLLDAFAKSQIVVEYTEGITLIGNVVQ